MPKHTFNKQGLVYVSRFGNLCVSEYVRTKIESVDWDRSSSV